MWEGESNDQAWERFLALTVNGRGLCVSREFPHRVKSRIGMRDISVVWLSNVGREESIRPGDLAGLLELCRSALVDGKVGAILLEGLEYLVTIHTLPKILEFLGQVDGLAKEAHATILVPVNPGLLGSSAGSELRQAFPG